MKTQNNILRITVAALAAATLLSGCVKEVDEKDAANAAHISEGEYELIVEVGEVAATKTTITQDGTILPVVWKAGDKLYVAGATDGYIGCLELAATQASGEGVGYHTAKFKGITSGWTSTQILHFYYLGSSEPTLNGNKFTFDISNQEGTLAWIEASGQISHAATSNALAPGATHILSLTMSNMNAIILYDLSEWTSGVAISGTFNKAVLDLKTGTFNTTDCTGDISLASDKCTSSTYVTFIPEDDMVLSFVQGDYSSSTKANDVKSGRFYSDSGDAIKIIKHAKNVYIEHTKDWGPGININGLIWAPVNCGIWDGEYPNGKLYQWGRKYGQPYSPNPSTDGSQKSLSDGNIESYSNTHFTVNPWYQGATETDVWTSVYDPCPDGWRVPTSAELESLLSLTYEWNDDTKEIVFYEKPSKTGKSIILYASGCRLTGGADASGLNEQGTYYSSNTSSDRGSGCANHLSFSSGNVPRINQDGKSDARAVRCVYAGE